MAKAKTRSSTKPETAKKPEPQKVNKSEAVRELLAQGQSPKEIVETLKAKGIDVALGHVYGLKSKASGATGSRPRANGKASTNGHVVSVEALLGAKAFVGQSGSIESAKEALAVLEKITG